MSDLDLEDLRSTFPSYMAEGERLYLCGEYQKAALCFTKALRLQMDDPNCLVARSKCYLKLGDLENSLKDVEKSLQNDQTFCKGILQKAETLYTMGDFEFALVYYHRGYKLRPDREFKVGIQKAQEAINNSVGNLIKGTIKRGMTVEDLIMTGINYLDTRTDFWRQQKPIYARERDRKLMQEKWVRDRKRRPSETARYILKSLEEIDLLLTSGNAEGSCQKAEKVLKKVLEWDKEEVPNKDELLGNLYSCIGNAQIEMGHMAAALQSHRKDLEIARKYELPDAKSRALDNIGRVYARVGKFQQAIDTWEEKIPLAKTSLEKTWLFHEIGRCYLELNRPWEAQEYGLKSQACAEEEGDVEWQLNASVLVAQAQVKLKDYEAAVSNFEKALERAKLVHNNEAQNAIISALDDANKGIIEELRATRGSETVKEKKDKEEIFEDAEVEKNEEKEKEDMDESEGERGESDDQKVKSEEEIQKENEQQFEEVQEMKKEEIEHDEEEEEQEEEEKEEEGEEETEDVETEADTD
ncbi:tetratricopeptide repeat protein 25 isoform X2 [Sarcophilus harrisii]|uniref:tetratricopeptide repeat protein 25 isoform X2 n=1 Tax=Sarcophilus harrisii TaxID=9305 RepID=UPI001301C1F2|nr:tetratricopeptide repeat protein 25 isoform X2 [Sarcophilus harrisii]